MSENILTKYRPTLLGEVIGQRRVIKSINELLRGKSKPHAFLFSGPAGVGKTTIARALAPALNVMSASPNAIIEIDAASNNGIDNVRELQAEIQYPAPGLSPNRLVILDECHSLTSQSWQALLKAIEEPPPYIYWAFCTTEPSKVPSTIQSRCVRFTLDLVDDDAIEKLLREIAEEEEWEVKDEIYDVVIKAASGSVRAAIAGLAQVHHCTGRKAAWRTLNSLDPSRYGNLKPLLQAIVNDKLENWVAVRKLLEEQKKENHEAIRKAILGYTTAVLMNAKTERQAQHLMEVLAIFVDEDFTQDGFAKLCSCVGMLFQWKI